jgi:hypothetical protein
VSPCARTERAGNARHGTRNKGVHVEERKKKDEKRIFTLQSEGYGGHYQIARGGYVARSTYSIKRFQCKACALKTLFSVLPSVCYTQHTEDQANVSSSRFFFMGRASGRFDLTKYSILTCRPSYVCCNGYSAAQRRDVDIVSGGIESEKPRGSRPMSRRSLGGGRQGGARGGAGD